MAKEKIIELSVEGLEELKSDLEDIVKVLESEDLKKYIGNKCLELLKQISMEKLTTISEDDIDSSYYISEHKMEIDGDLIYIFNESVIDISTKEISEEHKANYPLFLSLSKIVEYGIGYIGTFTPQSGVEDGWQYDVNQHGNAGWYYKDNKGQYHWTMGFEGRLIFHELEKRVLENANDWLLDYLEKKLK